ncbi:hypothetical protein KVT40_006970 [Elsinoe batatas]|uniref:Uncharacterized protein n=1 Tax=Elsinoe batatas TaxID=2601811 RepID=A0A8K0KWI2_9PEZI|nr:hypothetical protein KVT40_006970 [Elsinoe batatas]
MWLFTLRNFPLLTSYTPRKGCRSTKPESSESSPASWSALGLLAQSLGFKNGGIISLVDADPVRKIVQSLFSRLGHDSTQQHVEADQVAEILRGLHRKATTTPDVALTDDAVLGNDHRCGRPFADDFEHCQPILFLPLLSTAPISSGADITSIYALLDNLKAFLGCDPTKLMAESAQHSPYQPDPSTEMPGFTWTDVPESTRQSRSPTTAPGSDSGRGQAEGINTFVHQLRRDISEDPISPGSIYSIPASYAGVPNQTSETAEASTSRNEAEELLFKNLSDRTLSSADINKIKELCSALDDHNLKTIVLPLLNGFHSDKCLLFLFKESTYGILPYQPHLSSRIKVFCQEVSGVGLFADKLRVLTSLEPLYVEEVWERRKVLVIGEKSVVNNVKGRALPFMGPPQTAQMSGKKRRSQEPGSPEKKPRSHSSGQKVSKSTS